MDDSSTPTSAWLAFTLGTVNSTGLCEHLRLATPEPARVGSMIQQFLDTGDRQLVQSLADKVSATALARQSHSSTQRKVDQALAWEARSSRHHLLGLDHPAYPALLQNIAFAPPLLYVKGDLAAMSHPLLAIVGSRKASHSALAHTRQTAHHLASRGMGIVSGLALGIDAAAHNGALEANGITLAVAATEPDSVYPKRHADLAQRILDNGGLIITEIPIGCPTKPWCFPRRNRIISGLSLGVLVAEAGLPSGTMTTAVHAMGQGREVMAVPGSVHNLQAKGCHALIKQGAALVESTEDILDVLGSEADVLLSHGANTDSPRIQTRLDLDESDIDGAEKTLLNCLSTESQSLDELMNQTTFSVSQLSSMLGLLEIKGIIRTSSSGRYTRC